MEFVTFSQIFSICFVLGDFTPDPTEGSVPVWTKVVTKPLFVPIQNKFLRPWRACLGFNPLTRTVAIWVSVRVPGCQNLQMTA